MNEEDLKALPDDQFFALFLEAVNSTYEEYRSFKAQEEGLNSYSEPVFEAAMSEFDNRVDSLLSKQD